MLRFACLLGVGLLAGCAAVPTVETAPQTPPLAAKPIAEKFQLTGRVAVKYDGQAFSGGLRWQHSAVSDEILLSSPLGQGMAQIVRDEAGVSLISADAQTYHAQDAEELTEAVLGWRLPLAGLLHWVRGEAAPGEHQAQHDAGALMRLEQDGWQIDYLGYRDVNGRRLPQKIFLQRGDLDIRLVIDTWSVP